MKRPLPPELVALGDELERDVRHRVTRPVRRQLALGVMAMFVITVPMAISVTSAELSRPVSELETAQPASSTTSSLFLKGRRPIDDVLPRSMRRGVAGEPTVSEFLVEPSPLRPALR
jgi:hypothetical protein